MINSHNMEIDLDLRTCKKCGIEKPIEAFSPTYTKWGGHRYECRECERDRRYAYERQSAEIIKEKYGSVEKRREAIRKATEWNRSHPERRRKTALSHYYRLQEAAILAYGGYKCSCCGIEEPTVMCLDHIKNDGSEHRKELGFLGGAQMYRWARDNGYPPVFQVPCFNCNHAKRVNGGKFLPALIGRCNGHPVKGVGSSDPKREASQVDDDMVSSHEKS